MKNGAPRCLDRDYFHFRIILQDFVHQILMPARRFRMIAVAGKMKVQHRGAISESLVGVCSNVPCLYVQWKKHGRTQGRKGKKR